VYETNKREQQITQQNEIIRKRNIQLIVFIIMLVLLVIIGYLIYKRYKWKQELVLQREITKQQEEAARDILEAEEKQRSRIAKDLHDGVGQMMSVARMNLSSLYNELRLQEPNQQESFKNIITLVNDSCKEVRTVSHSMMPAALQKNGLVAAIQEMIDRIRHDQLEIHFHHEGADLAMNPTRAAIIYRIIQECINNVVKHAQAKHLDISYIHDEHEISITIEDDGIGFSHDPQQQDIDGIGLKNIKSRIQFLKGTINVDSRPGKGTSIVVHIPEE
jgi:signal transduction histidine kinase